MRDGGVNNMKNYKIAVAGTGYVGLSIATLLSQHHQVTAVDIVPEKVELINNRKSPIQDDYIEKYLAEKELNLTATLDAKSAWPSHYRFLYNRKMKQIAVQACGAEESGAHRVGKPDESNSDEIKCMALVRMIYGDSGWDKKMSYRLIGRAFPQQRLVSFKITDAMQIENGRVLTEM